jgi:hypothetical protein
VLVALGGRLLPTPLSLDLITMLINSYLLEYTVDFLISVGTLYRSTKATDGGLGDDLGLQVSSTLRRSRRFSSLDWLSTRQLFILLLNSLYSTLQLGF